MNYWSAEKKYLFKKGGAVELLSMMHVVTKEKACSQYYVLHIFLNSSLNKR